MGGDIPSPRNDWSAPVIIESAKFIGSTAIAEYIMFGETCLNRFSRVQRPWPLQPLYRASLLSRELYLLSFYDMIVFSFFLFCGFYG